MQMQILRRTDGAVLFSGDFATVRAMMSAAAGSNLAYAQLTPTWFGRAGYGDTKCEGLNLSNTDFTGANLRGMKLVAANLNGSNFTGAYMRGVFLGEHIDANRDDDNPGPPVATVAGANFTNAELSVARMTRVDFSAATLTGALLTHADFPQANLSGLNLSGMRLRHTRLVMANLTGANLDGADMRDCMMDGADLDGASLVATDLRGVDVSKLLNADLSQAIIDGRYWPDELPTYDYDYAPPAAPLPYDHLPR